MENIITTKTKLLRGISFAFYLLIVASGIFLSQLIVDAFADRYNIFPLLTSTFNAILWVGFTLPLAFIASKKYTRIVFIVLSSLYLIRLVTLFVLTGYDTAGTLTYSMYGTVTGIFNLTLPIIAAYFLSVILNTESIEPKTRKWLLLIIVSYTLTFIGMFSSSIFSYFIDIKGIEGNWSLQYQTSVPYYIYIVCIFGILKAIAYFKFIYSPIFDGNYDPDAKGNFNPLNKYFLGIIGAAAIGLAGLAAVYYFSL